MASNADIEAVSQMVLVVSKWVWTSSNLVCQVRRVGTPSDESSTQSDTHSLEHLVRSVHFLTWFRCTKREGLIPVIEFECGASGRAGDPTHNFKMLVAVDIATLMLNAVGVQSKGPTDKHASEAMTSFIQDSGHTPVTVRSDGEHAIAALLEALRYRVVRHESIEKVIIQAARVHSHQRMATSERSIQTIRTSDADTRVTVATESWHRTSS